MTELQKALRGLRLELAECSRLNGGKLPVEVALVARVVLANLKGEGVDVQPGK